MNVAEPVTPQLHRRLRLFDATTIVVGSMIGSGIFVAPSIMAQEVHTPGILVGLWVFGGVFTILGALSYAELAAMSPHAGGQYVFLREAYGDFWAFLFGWTNFVVIQTGFNAAVAIAFAKYLGVLIPDLGEENVLAVIPLTDLVPALADVSLPDCLRHLEINSAQFVACGVIGLLTLVNIQGIRHGVLVQNLFTVLKVAALAALIVAGLTAARSDFSHLRPVIPGDEVLKVGFMASLAVALSKAMFAYDAWNTVTFVAEEVRESERTLPRALVLGSLVTAVIYVLTNVAYLAVLPIGDMADVPENRVGQAVASVLFGDIGFAFVIAAILISTFGCVNGMLLGGARVYYAMARQGLFFRRCASLHPTKRTPAAALLYEGAWSAVLVFAGSYTELLTFTTFASIFFIGLTVAGVYRLRRTQPDRPRPYRCWGYPVTPALYLLICVPFLIYLVKGAPQPTLFGTLLVLAGIPFYRRWRRRREV